MATLKVDVERYAWTKLRSGDRIDLSGVAAIGHEDLNPVVETAVALATVPTLVASSWRVENFAADPTPRVRYKYILRIVEAALRFLLRPQLRST